MSGRPELEPMVVGWLHDEAASAGADRVLRAALATIETTNQDRYVTQRLFGDQLGRSKRLRWTLLAAALALALLGTIALAAGALLRDPTPVPRPATNGWIAFGANGEAGADLSGTEIGRGGTGNIYVARGGVAARRIVGTAGEGAPHLACPAFSPDGTRLAYTELDTASVTSTPLPRPEGSEIDEEPPPVAGGPEQPAWSIVVVEVASDGTPTTEVARLPAPGINFCAAWSPDGRALAYVVHTSSERAELRVTTLDGITVRRGPAALFKSAFAWSPDSLTVAVLDGGPPRLVPVDGGAPSVLPGPDPNAVEWSDDGLLAVGTGDLVTVMTADGSRIADIDTDVDVSELGDVAFAWSPDGTWIAWANADGIVRSRADGTGRERREVDVPGLLDDYLAEPLYPSVPSVIGWSPDGTQVLLAAGGIDTPGAILAVPWAVDQSPVVLVKPTYALRGIGATWQGEQE